MHNASNGPASTPNPASNAGVQECSEISLNAQFLDDLRYMSENALDETMRVVFVGQLRQLAELLIGYRA